MNSENTTYEQHTAVARKHLRLILIILLAVALILGSVFCYVACMYNQTDLSLILKNEDAFHVVDGFLFPKADDYTTSGNYVASYNLNTGDLYEYPVETFDLSDYGLEGYYHYFRHLPPASDLNASDEAPVSEYKGRIVSANYWELPLSRANTDKKFVCVDADGQKFLLDTTRKTAAPLFADSTAEGVDPYGGCITAFSHNGVFAIGKKGGALVIYVRDSADSFAIGTVHEVDFSEHGILLSTEFVSESYVLVTCTDAKTQELSYFICDARTGEVADAPLPENAKNYDQTALHHFAPLWEEDGEFDTEIETFRYASVFNGKVYEHALPVKVAQNRFPCREISPRGDYAFFSYLDRESGEEVQFFSKAGGRQFSVQSLYGEILDTGDKIEDGRVYFLSENIVLANVTRSDHSNYSIVFKICF